MLSISVTPIMTLFEHEGCISNGNDGNDSSNDEEVKEEVKERCWIVPQQDW